MPTHDAFGKMLMCHHKKVEKRLRDAGVDIPQPFGPETNPGLFFWLQDNLDAVFLLSHTGTTTRGLAFRTRDAKLIEVFKSTLERTRL